MRVRFALIVLFVVFALASPVLAQPTSEEPTTPGQWYGSVGGIVLATGIAVGILKRAFAKVSVLNQIPVWLYSVLVSAGLTYLSNTVWHTLPGELGQLLMQSVLMAATASGFYEWLNADAGGVGPSMMKPLADSATSQAIIRKR